MLSGMEQVYHTCRAKVKRGRGEIDNAAGTNPQTGGASPTRPLLINPVFSSAVALSLGGAMGRSCPGQAMNKTADEEKAARLRYRPQ